MKYLKTDFYYDLPEELIAQTPAEPRDSSRLLVYDRENKTASHKIFRDVVDYLKAGDVLVVNTQRCFPQGCTRIPNTAARSRYCF